MLRVKRLGCGSHSNARLKDLGICALSMTAKAPHMSAYVDRSKGLEPTEPVHKDSHIASSTIRQVSGMNRRGNTPRTAYDNYLQTVTICADIRRS